MFGSTRKCPDCGRRSPICDIAIEKVTKPEHGRIEIFRRFPICGHLIRQSRYVTAKRTFDGYLVMPGPKRSGDGKVRIETISEHRFIWEQAHGELPEGMVIHHINGVKDDNRLENLIALPRRKHNSAMRQTAPFNVTCPHCSKSFQAIKLNKNEMLAL